MRNRIAVPSRQRQRAGSYRFIKRLCLESRRPRPTVGRSSDSGSDLRASSQTRQGTIVPPSFSRFNVCLFCWQATCRSHYEFFMRAGGQTSMSPSSSTSSKAWPTPMTGRSRRSTSSGDSTPRSHVAKSQSMLWRAVIYKALEDLARGAPAAQLEAARWISSDACRAACYFAGCGTEKLKEVARRIAIADRVERTAILRRLRAQAMKSG